MRMIKRIIIGGLAVILVLLAGCEKEEIAVADLGETEIVEEVDVHPDEETIVDEYWSQTIESKICKTVGECRDLGDAYGSEHFTSFLSGLTHTNNMSFLSVGATEDENVFAITKNDVIDDEPIIARYEMLDDQFVLTRGEEDSVFRGIANLVLALYDWEQVNFQYLDFQENVYPHVDVYSEKLVLPSNLIPHWLQSFTVTTLIHEYGHFLTWNKSDFDTSETCATDLFYVKPYGECYHAESYMNLYYKAFLKEYDEHWLHDANRTAEGRLAFYEEHKDSFLTAYATVNPYEDIAESFTHFMLTPYNDSPQTIPEEKVNFFYQFPELVEYRAFVLKELKNRKDDMWSFY